MCVSCGDKLPGAAPSDSECQWCGCAPRCRSVSVSRLRLRRSVSFYRIRFRPAFDRSADVTAAVSRSSTST